MAYDPEDNTQEQHINAKHFNGKAIEQAVPNNLEPELKYLVQDKQVFNKTIQTVVNSELTETDKLRIIPTNYRLLSICMDTVDLAHTDDSQEPRIQPTQEFYKAGYQYRTRMNLTADFSTSYTYADAALKCRKIDGRVEFETKANELSPNNLDNSLSVLKNTERDVDLPQFLTAVDDEHLRVEALYLTERSNYYFGLDMGKGGVVLYHVCADSNRFLTPTGEMPVGQDFEAEYEIKSIFNDQVMSRDAKVNIINEAQDKLREILAGHIDAGELDPSRNSKQVRATKSVMKYYKIHHPDVPYFSSSDASQKGLIQGIRPSEVVSFDRHTNLANAAFNMEKVGDLIVPQQNIALPGQRLA